MGTEKGRKWSEFDDKNREKGFTDSKAFKELYTKRTPDNEIRMQLNCVVTREQSCGTFSSF